MIKYTANRRVGLSHIASGKPCQDNCSGYHDGDVASMVLCDGAGSVENSEKISELISVEMSKYLVEHFDEMFYEMDDETLKDVILSYTNNLVYSTYGLKADCTFLAAVMDDEKSLVIHIGDGLIFGINEEAEVVSFAENGDEPNITFFLSGKTAQNHLRIQRFEARHESYLLCSDGISSSLYNRLNNKIAKAVVVLVRWLQTYDVETTQEKIQLELKEFFSQYSNDDMSIAMISNYNN